MQAGQFLRSRTLISQATAIDRYCWLKNDIIRGIYQPDEKLRMSLLNKLESRYASETMLDKWDPRHQAFHTTIMASVGRRI